MQSFCSCCCCSCCCFCCYCVILLLQQQQNYTWKTTRKKQINLHTFSVQLSISHWRMQITGRHTYVRCAPLVVASGGQEWYYIMSASHLQSDVRSAWHLQSGMSRSDVPPGRGIWWPRVVLHQVSLIFTVRHTQVRCNPLVEASGGQEWYYIRSASHLQSDVKSAWHLQPGMARSDVSNKLQCRRMSTVLKLIWVHEQLTRKSM